ncbi:MAG: iron-containing alcohol dehydrogenase family protein [Thermoplasmata archaeon]
MSIITKTVSLPVFIEIGNGLIPNIGAIIHRANLHFERVLILTGPTSTEEIARAAARSLNEFGYEIRIKTVKSNTHEEAKKVIEAIDEYMPDLVMAIGGGRVIDVGKYATHERMLNFIAVPTSASNDGIASPIAVIQFNGRTKRVKSILCHMPIGVIADLSIISKAPAQLLRAGTGDLIGNLSSSKDYELASRKKGIRMDNFARIIAYQAANTLLHTHPRSYESPEFLTALVDGLIMSGVSMGIAGNSMPASGAEHIISHALDRIFPGKFMHGLQVALALPFTFGLRGEDPSVLNDFYKELRLPRRPEDMGISKEKFIEAALMAIFIRPERYTVLNEVDGEKVFREIYKKVYE